MCVSVALLRDICCLSLIEMFCKMIFVVKVKKTKKQEPIQSGTTSLPRHHVGERQKHKETSHTREPIQFTTIQLAITILTIHHAYDFGVI